MTKKIKFHGELLTRLSDLEYYQEFFTFVYGDNSITEERIQLALSDFIRSIKSFDSKYDVGRSSSPNEQNDFSNFSADENVGKNLFLLPPPQNGFGCAGCHQPPEFSIIENSGNNGVVGVFGTADTDFTITRSPSLRDIVKSNGSTNGAFMHDASLATLDDVIDHYDQGIQNVTGLDPKLLPGGNPQRLNMTALEKTQLKAFLQTLTGTALYTDEKWSDPF